MAASMSRKQMNKWKECFAKKVELAFPEVYQNCDFYWGDPENPSHNVDKSNQQRYVVCIFPAKGLFCVWDYKRHRKYKQMGASQSSVTLGCGWDEVKILPCVYYKRLGNHRDSPYEKVYVVPEDDWRLFFSHIDEYMHFNQYDLDPSGKTVDKSVFACENEEYADDERKRYSSQKLQRRTEFSKKVMEAYDYQCAICRCNLREVLQAAHLHGYEVSATDLSADKPENGIALCANHHLMYDSELIDINIHKGTISINDDRIKQMPWYSEFYKNGFKLLERKKEK